MSRRALGVLSVVAAASLWGSWTLLLRPTGLSAYVTSPIIFAGIAVVMACATPFDRAGVEWSRGAVALSLLNGAFNAVNVLTFFLAMSTTSVAVAVLTHYMAPVLIALLAPYVDGERVRGARGAAVLATTALLLVLAPWRSAGDAGNLWLGATFGAISAVAYAGNVFVTRRVLRRIGVTRGIALHSMFAALLLAPFIRLGGGVEITSHAWLLLALGALLPGALAGGLFVFGLREIGPSRAGLLALIEPLVAMGIGYFVWKESLAIEGVVGVVLVLGAARWVNRPGTETETATATVTGTETAGEANGAAPAGTTPEAPL